MKKGWCYLLQHRVKLQNCLPQPSVCWAVLVKQFLGPCAQTGPAQCAVGRAAGGTAGGSSACLHTLPLALQQERGMDGPPELLWLHPIAAVQVPLLSPQPGLLGLCQVPGKPAAGSAQSRSSAIRGVPWLLFLSLSERAQATELDRVLFLTGTATDKRIAQLKLLFQKWCVPVFR